MKGDKEILKRYTESTEITQCFKERNEMKVVNKKPSVTSLRIEITDDFNDNIETISELILIALAKSVSVPQLAIDGFLVRVSLQCRDILEVD